MNENNEGKSKGLNRRDFLKSTGGAAAVGLGVLGMTPSQAGAVPMPKKWDREADIIVMGGGGAGLFAALAAHDAGAKVLLLEKADTLYLSTSAICGGGVSAGGTKVQKEKGMQDSADLFYEEMLKAGQNRNDPEIIRLFVDNAADTINWFADRGMQFFMRGYPGFSVNRQHSNLAAAGKEYIEIMAKEIQKRNIPILFETKAMRLVVDPKGEVRGVEANRKGKKLFFKARRATILCSGGFAGVKDMVDRFMIPFKGAICSASFNSAGDGFLMATKEGAGSTHLGYGAVYAYGFITHPAERRGLVHRGYEMASVGGAIIINKEGKRFIREETTPTGVSLRLVDQPDQTLFVVGDKPMLDSYLSMKMPGVIGWTSGMVAKEAQEQKMFIKTAETLDELAKKCGIDPEGLKKAIVKYNGYVDAGSDPDFGRAKQNLRAKIEKPPFCALSGQPIALASTGGLKVNKELKVLDPYLVPIPRLYAAGETIGGLHGAQYLGGCGFGSALTFGRIAGKNAAQEKPAK